MVLTIPEYPKRNSAISVPLNTPGSRILLNPSYPPRRNTCVHQPAALSRSASQTSAMGAGRRCRLSTHPCQNMTVRYRPGFGRSSNMQRVAASGLHLAFSPKPTINLGYGADWGRRTLSCIVHYLSDEKTQYAIQRESVHDQQSRRVRKM